MEAAAVAGSALALLWVWGAKESCFQGETAKDLTSSSTLLGYGRPSPAYAHNGLDTITELPGRYKSKGQC